MEYDGKELSLFLTISGKEKKPCKLSVCKMLHNEAEGTQPLGIQTGLPGLLYRNRM